MPVALQIIEYKRHPERFPEGEEGGDMSASEASALPPLDLRSHGRAGDMV